jgi:capsule polysaccharide export protein KpsE/RkpR
MTNEQLIKDCELAAECLAERNTFETVQAILKDAAARIKEQAAEIEGLRAEMSDGSWYKESDIDNMQNTIKNQAAEIKQLITCKRQ